MATSTSLNLLPYRCSYSKKINSSIQFSKSTKIISIYNPTMSIKQKVVDMLKVLKNPSNFEDTILDDQTQLGDISNNINKPSQAMSQIYAILDAISDRIEMHKNVEEQRNNWNTLLLNSINLMTLTATATSGLAAARLGGLESPITALKVSSTILFAASTGMLLIMNKIQPSQLAEEQRNAVRLFKELHNKIHYSLALDGVVASEEYVDEIMEQVMALDRAYPLPLLGAMLEKFPTNFEPARWWISQQRIKKSNILSKQYDHDDQGDGNYNNGWSEELELETKAILEVVKNKDFEDYIRLGNLALKINKFLAISGPTLTGIAAIGSAFVGTPGFGGSWGATVALAAGALAAAVNSFEHGGQVGMLIEMYRNCAGFFRLMEESIESTLEEKDVEDRENGELFKLKVALKLGRSFSQLKDLARKSTSSNLDGTEVDEFASKLF